MLRVTIDMVPFGDEGQVRNLETLQIINTGLNAERPEWGNYKVKWSGGEFMEYDHRREDGYLPLVHRIITSIWKYDGRPQGEVQS